MKLEPKGELCWTPFGGEETSVEAGVSMRVMKCLCSVWRRWCEMWRFNWDEHGGPDYHKWESKMEIRRRLSGSPRHR